MNGGRGGRSPKYRVMSLLRTLLPFRKMVVIPRVRIQKSTVWVMYIFKLVFGYSEEYCTRRYCYTVGAWAYFALLRERTAYLLTFHVLPFRSSTKVIHLIRWIRPASIYLRSSKLCASSNQKESVSVFLRSEIYSSRRYVVTNDISLDKVRGRDTYGRGKLGRDTLRVRSAQECVIGDVAAARIFGRTSPTALFTPSSSGAIILISNHARNSLCEQM